MIEVSDEVLVESRSVACDGGEGALGHPRVWLAIDRSGQVECPYCSRRFILRTAEGKSSPAPSPPAEAEAAS